MCPRDEATLERRRNGGHTRLAVVGSGISGMAAAWLLSQRHEVDVLEAEDRLGGHTHTIDITVDGRDLAVDIGFMVFNHRTYPNLVRLFEHLGIDEQPADMSFSVQSLVDDVEWRGDPAGLFAQPANLFRGRFWRMLAEILRLSRDSARLLADPTCDEITLGELLEREGYGRAFTEWYLVPMGAAIWSTPTGRMLDFPAGSFLRFCDNHGLLHVTGKPPWMSVPGGARCYTLALADRGSGRVRTGGRVVRVRRLDDGVVLASHADQTLTMLEDPREAERDVLSAFEYGGNDTVLHTDGAVMPIRRGAWAAWNYVTEGRQEAASPCTIGSTRCSVCRCARPCSSLSTACARSRPTASLSGSSRSTRSTLPPRSPRRPGSRRSKASGTRGTRGRGRATASTRTVSCRGCASLSPSACFRHGAACLPRPEG